VKILVVGVLLLLVCGSLFLIMLSPTAPPAKPSAPSEESERILQGELVPKPAHPKPARLEVVGTGPSGPIRVGERFYGEFRLKNAGTEDLWVVGSLDGSFNGRPPASVLEIRDEAGQLQKIQLPGVCGVVDPFGEDAFKNLKPGEVLERSLQSTLPWWRPTQPGTYTIVLTYDSTSPYLQNWAGGTGRLSARCRELLALVPKGKFVSNPVRITVVP
jgi:hypothetical protein